MAKPIPPPPVQVDHGTNAVGKAGIATTSPVVLTGTRSSTGATYQRAFPNIDNLTAFLAANMDAQDLLDINVAPMGRFTS
jgi:hypothetical protein